MEKCQYDELKAQQEIHWWFTGKREIVLDFAETHAGLKKNSDVSILDVGCGMGLMLDSLVEYGNVSGMDMESEAVDYCKENAIKKGNNIDVRKGSLPNEVPFDKETFDYIFALDVIEHVKNDVRALMKLYSLLKPSGKLILTVPALMNMWSYNDELNHHFRRYEKKELLNKVKRAHFKIIKCSFYNSYLFVPAWIVRKIKNGLKIETTDVSNNTKNGYSNRILKWIFTNEKNRLRKGEFKRGVSLIIVCEKME